MRITSITAIITIGLWSCEGHLKSSEPRTEQFTAWKQVEIKKQDTLNIDFQFEANCEAYSSPKNAEKSNGEAHSDNLPHKVDQSFPKHGFYLCINQDEFSKIDSTNLYSNLYLVNTTDTLIRLEASDSRLYIVAEALNDQNEWAPISYLPSTKCGNSLHTIVLDKDEYWRFDIPSFQGDLKTKLRYTLTIDKDTKISSNEIVVYLNKGQFNKKTKAETH